MSEFKSKLKFEDDFGGFPFVLTEDFIYHSDRLARDIIVPVGFKTDLASIPRGLWNVLPKVGPWDWASVVHDFLYNTGLAVDGKATISRGDADAVIFEAMGAVNGPKVDDRHRRIIYFGVRAGGFLGWRRSRSHDGDSK